MRRLEGPDTLILHKVESFGHIIHSSSQHETLFYFLKNLDRKVMKASLLVINTCLALPRCLKWLSRYFSISVISLFTKYINLFISEYAKGIVIANKLTFSQFFTPKSAWLFSRKFQFPHDLSLEIGPKDTLSIVVGLSNLCI